MTSANTIRRSISFAIFGLGILGGLYGCAVYPRGWFTIGANDSYQEIWAITLAFATPFLACILALWKRVLAGAWLIFAGCFFPYGMLAQRTYMIQVAHFPDQPSILETFRSSLTIALPLVAVGAFGVITGLLKWPKLLGKPDMVGSVDESSQ